MAIIARTRLDGANLLGVSAIKGMVGWMKGVRSGGIHAECRWEWEWAGLRACRDALVGREVRGGILEDGYQACSTIIKAAGRCG